MLRKKSAACIAMEKERSIFKANDSKKKWVRIYERKQDK